MMNTRQNGFTLIELMIVIAIISILATMAAPSYQDRIIRSQVQEALRLAEIAKSNIEEFYTAKQRLPADNGEAGMPPAKKMIGNYVTGLHIAGGAIHISLGNRINRHAAGKTVTIRPAVVPDEPLVPIAWIPGFAPVPQGMTVIGKNNSDLLPRLMPINCR